MKQLFALAFICCTLSVKAQFNIVPQPAKAVAEKGSFQLSPKTTLVLMDEGEQLSANFLNEYLERFYGFRLNTAKQATSNYIKLVTRRFIQPGQDGKYSMQVRPQGINIEGDTYQGTFYGVQTLIQLLPLPSGAGNNTTAGTAFSTAAGNNTASGARNNSFGSGIFSTYTSNIASARNPGTTLTIPAATIEDQPRFQYRGLHLDVSRHFMPVDFLKKYIDYLAMHKMNFFHWHLTDDQGWRIEIKKYPRLTEVGGWRNGTIIGRYPGKGNDNIRYGGFYTQEQVKEVVAYAATRYITVVPEIEMPGHASAAIAAFPWLSCFPNEKTKIPDNMISEASKQATGKLVQETWGVFEDVFCAGNDSTFQFLQDVMDEVIPLFPGQYVHVGGDECPKSNWKKCPRCQERIKAHNLKDEHGLQSYFIQRMEKYINAKGKTIIGWDEILEGGLAPNAIVMSWRGEAGGIEAAKENHQAIMTPGSHVYFDHSQTKNEDSVTIGGYTPLEKVYAYEPVPKELPADKHKFVLGAQANVWTEYIKNTAKVEYHVFPRLAALSEVVWSPAAGRNYKNFEKGLPVILKRYELWGTNYSRAYYDLRASILPAPGNKGVLWSLHTNSPATIFVTDTSVKQKSRVQVPDWKKDSQRENGIMKDSVVFGVARNTYRSPIHITKSTTVFAETLLSRSPDGKVRVESAVSQKFSFNKATGKKITLAQTPSPNYPGNGGAFGLINGASSEKGISSVEWLGWSGTDMEAIVDLLSPVRLSTVGIHTLEQNGSWIYLPALVEVHISKDGKKFTKAGSASAFEKDNSGFLSGYINVTFTPTTARFIKVVAKNYGKIPEGKPGGGHPAWLFVDEIRAD